MHPFYRWHTDDESNTEDWLTPLVADVARACGCSACVCVCCSAGLRPPIGCRAVAFAALPALPANDSRLSLPLPPPLALVQRAPVSPGPSRPADRQAAAAHTGSAEQREERGTPRVRPFAGRPTVRAKAATATAAAKMAAVPGLQPATPACVRLCVASVGRVSAQRTNCRPHHFWSASEPADKERTNRTANDAARSLCPKTCSSDTSTRIYRQPSNLQRSHVFTLLETASLRPVCKHLYRETLEFCVIARRYFNLI